MELPEPIMCDYENILILESNKNCYNNAILYMIIAQNKKKLPEKKILLKKSL